MEGVDGDLCDATSDDTERRAGSIGPVLGHRSEQNLYNTFSGIINTSLETSLRDCRKSAMSLRSD